MAEEGVHLRFRGLYVARFLSWDEGDAGSNVTVNPFPPPMCKPSDTSKNGQTAINGPRSKAGGCTSGFDPFCGVRCLFQRLSSDVGVDGPDLVDEVLIRTEGFRLAI
jgi:hypothetical protein